ncbi:MAG: D-alanyl-D-alanine carboxypeptidase/D-alanyl-D-alanine-endopeptidase [Pseudonocardia sp.]|nr:D-alanyl-D-alanine carboxypeptidase/D-alanyl-D-alanine-endopeptidase [Pseudonocardia sp.]
MPGVGLRRLAVVLVVLVAAAAIGGTIALSVPGLLTRLGGTPTPALPPAPQLVLTPLAATAPIPTTPALESALEEPLEAIPGTVSGVVRDALTGTVLWDHAAERSLVPGSTAKLLTAAAALLTLDPTSSLVTKAVAGPDAGTVVLVGGGDPTLTALPIGKEGVYPDPARLVDLAREVQAAMKGPITRVLIDTSRYEGPRLAEGWDPSDVKGGYIAPIESLMLDGGRVDPAAQDGERVGEPAVAAGKAFAELLGVDEKIETTTANPNAKVLGAVASAPISALVEHSLRASDNVLAEVLGREVARARGATADFAGATKATLAALAQAGFDTTGTQLSDTSGLSTEDRLSARVLGAVLAAAAKPSQGPHDVQFLRPILSGLPVAGGVGTLATRFEADGIAADGRGVVRAKTGTLTGVSTLAGVVTDADGRLLVFALMSNGGSPAAVRPRLDDLAAELSACGCR